MAGCPTAVDPDDWVATQILVVGDLDRSRAWWTGVLGAQLYREYGGTRIVLQFAGTRVLLVTGGRLTPDKPGVVLEPPDHAAPVSHAMTVRVADCRTVCESIRSRGGDFLTPPHDWGVEIRCFLRDPDGHLIEFSEATG